MSDALAITDADALGLAEVAEIQLRLARRFAERAEAEEDVDRACKLARATERAARGYRQSLLLKSRLMRDADRARREAIEKPLPRTPQQQSRIDRRVRILYEVVEAQIYAEYEDREQLDVADLLMEGLFETLEKMAKADDGFADADFMQQVTDLCERYDVAPPVAPSPQGRPGPPTAAAADSS